MFDHYATGRQGLPGRFHARAQRVGLGQTVADYIAGMTDRYCRQQYRRLISSPPKV
jgi:dGTP triphosphohydrolase